MEENQPGGSLRAPEWLAVRRDRQGAMVEVVVEELVSEVLAGRRIGVAASPGGGELAANDRSLHGSHREGELAKGTVVDLLARSVTDADIELGLLFALLREIDHRPGDP